MTATAGLRLVRWSARDLSAHLDEVMAVYAEAMGYPRSVTESRRGFVASHAHREGFRAVATVDPAGRVAGFSYGYSSHPGQWWHEQVRSGLVAEHGSTDYSSWFADAFELVELHVRPGHQGRGLGQGQLLALLAGLPHHTVLLSTPEGQSRAWRLYGRMGFQDVLRHYTFPGDDRPFAILGRNLPVAPPEAPGPAAEAAGVAGGPG
jgi:ribosomal protein S18 acetylase RimI-like enzyme